MRGGLLLLADLDRLPFALERLAEFGIVHRRVSIYILPREELVTPRRQHRKYEVPVVPGGRRFRQRARGLGVRRDENHLRARPILYRPFDASGVGAQHYLHCHRHRARFQIYTGLSYLSLIHISNEKLLPGVNSYGDRMTEHVHTDNLPEVHEAYRELRQVVDSVPGTVLIGETYLPNVEELAKAYGAKNDELQLPMDTQYGMGSKLSAELFRSKLRDAETGLNGNMPLLVFDNHDNRRSWTRFGDGTHDDAIARLIATLLLTPRDTALMYYGQELGMANNDPKSLSQVKDPIGKIGWPKEIGRDGERLSLIHI